MRRRVATGAGAILAVLLAGVAPVAAELKVSIGGYVKLDAAYQDQLNTAGKFRVHPDPSSVVFDEGPGRDPARAENDQFLLESRQSRFHITATDEIGQVKLKGFFQFDLFGGNDDESNSLVSSSHQPRIRHVYAQGEMPLGGTTLTLLVGQYWSTFMNSDIAPPDTIDFNGPSGQLFSRQPQGRVTVGVPFGRSTLNLIAAVQAQSVNFTTTDVSSPTAAGISAARQEGQNVPAFVAKVQWLSDLANAEIGGIWSQAKGIAPGGDRESASVWGVQASLNIPIGPLTVHLHGDRIDGLNREANGDFPDAVFTGDDVAPIRSTGGYAGVSYKLTPSATINAVYGIRQADDNGASGFGRGAEAEVRQETQQSIHVNLLHKFWQRFQWGVEYERQWVEAFRASEGSQNIYRVAFWYFF